jgi:flagellar hook-associated protein 3 FlgL
MITRTTTQTMMRSAQRNLQSNMAELARLQEQATSRTTINRPSDDPAGTADSLKVRADQRAVEQYSRNAENGTGWLTTIDSALMATEKIMNRVRDLTVRGANDGSMSVAAKEAIAVELNGLKEDLLKQANTTYLGRNVFAGNTDKGVAIDATSAYAFNGSGTDSVQRRIDSGTTVRVDANGSAIFGSGTVDATGKATSVFSLIDGIVADLGAGQNVGARLTEIDERMKTIVGQHAQVGAQQSQLERAQESLLAQKGALEAQRSGIEDVDLGQIILDLKTQEVSYQAALAVTARVLQPTLMDFLR